jgi:hypothetical protein
MKTLAASRAPSRSNRRLRLSPNRHLHLSPNHEGLHGCSEEEACPIPTPALYSPPAWCSPPPRAIPSPEERPAGGARRRGSDEVGRFAARQRQRNSPPTATSGLLSISPRGWGARRGGRRRRRLGPRDAVLTARRPPLTGRAGRWSGNWSQGGAVSLTGGQLQVTS